MVQFFCFLLSFFYVQRPGGRGLGGRVQSGDDLSVACGDSSPGRGAFGRCGGGDLSGAARQLPWEGSQGRRLSLGLPCQGRWLGGAETERSFQICDNLSVTFGDSFPGRGAFDRVVNATAADILAYLAVKRKKFYWNLTFF